MSTLKDCLREVREAAAENLAARHGAGEESASHPVPRDEALVSIAVVTVRLLEQQLQTDTEDSTECHELRTHLKACRKALKAYQNRTGASPATDSAAPARKRGRTEDDDGANKGSSPSASSSSPAAGRGDTSVKGVELGQYSASDTFGSNEEKRLKFARLMGGAKAALASKGGAGEHAHHNTHAKSSAELRRMNESLESQFDSAMSHRGKKGLGA